MPLRVLLIALMFAGCNSSSGSSERPVAAPMGSGSGGDSASGPGSGSGPGSSESLATVADAAPPTEFALFDHLAVRQVKEMTPRPTLALDPPPAAHPTLVVKDSARAADLAAAAGVPPWCQHEINQEPVTVFHTGSDGRSIAITAGTVVLIDAHHRAELGLDFTGTAVGDTGEAGDHTITDAGRAGDIVVAVIDSTVDSTQWLVAVDAKTGGIAWRTPAGTAFQRVAVVGGYVLAGRDDLIVAYRADTGRRVASAAVHHGPYQLGVAADGAVVGDNGDGQHIEVTVK